MTFLSGLIVFVIIWWLVLFMVLPFGVRTAEESNQQIGPGHAPSAPMKPRMGIKAAIATVAAFVLWSVYYYVAVNDLLNFRALMR